MTSTTMKTPNRFPDGRMIRTVLDERGVFGKMDNDRFTQKEFFFLQKKGLLLPSERIMDVRELDTLVQARLSDLIKGTPYCRSRDYGAYRRGFETSLDLQIGSSITFVESNISNKLEIPDVRHPNDPNLGLRAATGLVVFNSEKLSFNVETRIVSASDDFNPETDVRVFDAMRPRAWALANEYGIPMRDSPSSEATVGARLLYIMHANEFRWKSDGWHGSLARNIRDLEKQWKYVFAYDDWQFFSTAVVAGLNAADLSIIAQLDPKLLLERSLIIERAAKGLGEMLGGKAGGNNFSEHISTFFEQAAFLKSLAENVGKMQKKE